MADATREVPHLSMDRLDYHLPEELIARAPADPRDTARLMVIHRSQEAVEHVRVSDLPKYLGAGDRLVLNTTAVAPARLIGERADSGGRVEGLYLSAESEDTWRCMLRSNGRLRPGQQVRMLGPNDERTGVMLELLDVAKGEWRVRVAVVEGADVADVGSALERVGRTPLPPYILRSRKTHHEPVDVEQDRAWYQTVYADERLKGSVAAPTAGLHFTPALLRALSGQGVRRLDVTLHVGPGTFKPVTADTLDEHEMHREWFQVPGETLAALREAKAKTGDRTIAVGTTSVRTLESLPADLGELPAEGVSGETDLLIAPGYDFRHVDGMLTNFHLPRSTLLALVAAMLGLDRTLALYEEAVARGYRFYSYGDAMLILP